MQIELPKRKEKETNREYAYRALRYNIMVLKLLPGTTLNEGKLSEIFNISRTPIHEAIIQLKSEHLVEVYPQSGSRVSLIDMSILKEGLFLRSVVEPVILKQIAGNINLEMLAPLKENLDMQKSILLEENPIDIFFKLDDKFHQIIYNIANKSKTWYSIKSITTHYDRVRYIDAILNNTHLEFIYRQHKKMYNLILIGFTSDFNLDEFYENHLGIFRNNFEKLLEENSDYFLI